MQTWKNKLSKHHQRCTYFGEVIGINYFKIRVVEKDWWEAICRYGSLTEDFVREFVNEIDWSIFNQYIVLEGNMIREFKDYINLETYFKYGWFPLDFVREFKNELDWTKINTYYLKHLPDNIKKEFLNI